MASDAAVSTAGEVFQELSAAEDRLALVSDFEKALVTLFLYSKRKFASEDKDERSTSMQSGFDLMDQLNISMEYKNSMSSSALFRAFVRMRNLCASTNNLCLPYRKPPPVTEEVSDAEKDFVALVLTDYVNCPSVVHNERELENKLAALFLSIKSTIERVTVTGELDGTMISTASEVLLLERVKGAVIKNLSFSVSNITIPNVNFRMAVFALEMFVGYLAAEEASRIYAHTDTNASRTSDAGPSASRIEANIDTDAGPNASRIDANIDADASRTSDAGPSASKIDANIGTDSSRSSDARPNVSKVPSPVKRLCNLIKGSNKVGKSFKPFHHELYSYIAYKYDLIPEEDYTSLCSKTTTHHFTENLGKSVILLSFAYNSKLSEHLCEVRRDFSEPFDDIYFISKFVEDSVSSYPDSSYRYLVLLSLISQLANNFYIEMNIIHNKRDPHEFYLNKANKMYSQSGMEKFAELLRSSDNFQSLMEHSNRIAAAWESMESTVIAAQRSRYCTKEELMGETFIDEIELQRQISVQSSGEIERSTSLTTEVDNQLGAEGGAVGEERLEPEDLEDKTKTKIGCKPKAVKRKSKKKPKGKN